MADANKNAEREALLKAFKAKYVQPERINDRLIAKGTLRKGMKIGGEVAKEFEMREAITADLLAAETDASTENALNFNAALLSRQLVRVGTFEGPFTVGMIGKLCTQDFKILRDAQAEFDIVGEFD